MRVISLVPSLTETLLDSGVEVVGRTRFCIHPDRMVQSIPVVGGTKEVNWDTCADLHPDLIVMDREENTLQMAKSCPFPWHATHIVSIESVGDELGSLARRIESIELATLSEKWNELSDSPEARFSDWPQLPGFKQLIGSGEGDFKKIEYVIWKNPWMAVSRNTFIGSVLTKVGLGEWLPDHNKPYPKLDADAIPASDTFYLFSTEPYPFERYVGELESLGFNGALIDGELYSWFGSRSYRLLNQYLASN